MKHFLLSCSVFFFFFFNCSKFFKRNSKTIYRKSNLANVFESANIRFDRVRGRYLVNYKTVRVHVLNVCNFSFRIRPCWFLLVFASGILLSVFFFLFRSLIYDLNSLQPFCSRRYYGRRGRWSLPKGPSSGNWRTKGRFNIN